MRVMILMSKVEMLPTFSFHVVVTVVCMQFSIILFALLLGHQKVKTIVQERCRVGNIGFRLGQNDS